MKDQKSLQIYVTGCSQIRTDMIDGSTRFSLNAQSVGLRTDIKFRSLLARRAIRSFKIMEYQIFIT